MESPLRLTLYVDGVSRRLSLYVDGGSRRLFFPNDLHVDRVSSSINYSHRLSFYVDRVSRRLFSPPMVSPVDLVSPTVFLLSHYSVDCGSDSAVLFDSYVDVCRCTLTIRPLMYNLESTSTFDTRQVAQEQRIHDHPHSFR